MKMKKKDKVFLAGNKPARDFEFNQEVAEVFDDMLERSVPFYAEQLNMVTDIGKRFYIPGTKVYDLGCSTATMMIDLGRKLPPSARMVGYDNSLPMLERARKKIAENHFEQRIEVRRGELNGALSELPLILGATVNSIVALVIMYFLLYFMLTNCNELEDWMEDVLPLRKDNLQRVRHQMNQMVISNAVGIPLIALLQGIAGLILYLILGIKEPLLWFALTAFTSILPLVGSSLAYVPLAIIQFASGETTKGIIILVYGLGVIVTMDNVFRLWLQRRIGNVHPLITLFGVFVGVPLFGFIGLIFGPLLISIFILLMRIYRVEFIAPEESLDD